MEKVAEWRKGLTARHSTPVEEPAREPGSHAANTGSGWPCWVQLSAAKWSELRDPLQRVGWSLTELHPPCTGQATLSRGWCWYPGFPRAS